MKIRAILVDDEELALRRLRILLATEPLVEIIAECTNGPAAVETIQTRRPDVVFLDIQMPEMDGFGVIDALPAHIIPWTIFVTAYDQHAVQAFTARAIDYLLKPVEPERLHEALNRVRERLRNREPVPALQEWLKNRESLQNLAVRTGTKTIFVPVSSIDWVEASGNYVIVHAGGTNHILRATLGEIQEKLPADMFQRISRSAVVALRQVRCLEIDSTGKPVAVLHEGTRIFVTRSAHELRSLLG